jgi:replicative DNA helicase
MTSNVKLLFDLIDKGREGKNIGLKTGIDKLDKHVGGIQRGIYTLIFGLSGAGNVAF